ncbi:3'-5' exonuclease, partial [Thermococcus sp. GR4]
VKSEMLLDIIRNPMLIENLIITFTIEDLKEAAERAKEIWGYYAKKALLELIESYEKNERLYYAKHTDGKLYVDTMHSAKGLEADTVFILNELPKKVYKEAITNEGESEAKVLFVALTRARKKLVILNGIRTFERLDDAIRKAMKTNLG